MSIFIIFLLLLLGNWFLTDTLIYLPVNLLGAVGSFSRLLIVIVALLFLSWCLADD